MKKLFVVVALLAMVGCSKSAGIMATDSIPLPLPLGFIRGAFTASSIIKLYPECADRDNQGDCYSCIREIQAREGKVR